MCKVEPFVIIYEEFVLAYEEIATKALRFLDIPVPSTMVFAERKLKRQSDELTEKWVEAYHQHQ
jgi:LPS sulfotransferase NodH